MAPKPRPVLKLALPKGHMQQGVFALLADAGIQISLSERDYRPRISIADFECKILKPQNIVQMLHVGSRDIGFAGSDWVAENQADLVCVLDTGLDPVQVVAAAPKQLLRSGDLPQREILVASEYKRLTKQWIQQRGIQARFVRSYGATEVFPPEDADCIVDNTATGSTLRRNGLVIVDELMRSSTCLYANPRVLDDRQQRRATERLKLLLCSVLESRRRVMLEVNVAPERLEGVIEILPCMREPTISSLHGGSGYALKAAVLRKQLPEIIPAIKARGGTDIIVTKLSQIVP